MDLEQPLGKKFFEDLEKLVDSGELPQDVDAKTDQEMMHTLKQETNTFRTQKFKQLEDLLLG